MASAETNILRKCWKRAAQLKTTLWRNNVGVVRFPDGSVVRYGLCNGSHDLIGFTDITITPAMVGKSLPVLTSFEVKTDTGRVTSEQQTFLDFILSHNGISAIVRNEGDVEKALDDWRSRN